MLGDNFLVETFARIFRIGSRTSYLLVAEGSTATKIGSLFLFLASRQKHQQKKVPSQKQTRSCAKNHGNDRRDVEG